MVKYTYSPEMVDYMFGGLNQVSEEFRAILAKSISKLPMKIVDWTTENLLFISSNDDNYASYLPIEILSSKKGLVILSEILKNQTEDIQSSYIAHEIAHTYLGHVSPIMSNLSDRETKNQEEQATQLAHKWLG